MTFGVFIHRTDSIYDDSPAEQYQFPRQYLRRAQSCVGDWIIYYEPKKVRDTRGYFAVAKVSAVVPDPIADDMYIALIEPGSYADFSAPVAFEGAEGLAERGLLNEEGKISGRAQSAVRPISPADFGRIIQIGLSESAVTLPRADPATAITGFSDEQAVYSTDPVRDRMRSLNSRLVRDRIFRQVVLRAYDSRCAITGLKLINGGGRAEAEAAHIQPVEANGPDIINNGLALSGTAHWIFDRGIVSVEDDLKILVSRQLNDPESVRAMVNATGYLLTTRRPADRPHPRFLQWHRENCFKA